MNFIIQSYEGVEPIKFGMSLEDVVDIIGDPRITTKTWMGNLSCIYSDFSVEFTFDDVRVKEISFYKTAQLFYEGIDIFNDEGSFEYLLAKDGCPYELVGGIILLNLGLSITGFHDHDDSQKNVCVFRHGVFDHLRHKFVKYRHEA